MIKKVNCMRYSYEVKPVEGDSKTLHAMSYKKFLRKLSTEFKEGETVRVSYKNKKKTISWEKVFLKQLKMLIQ